MVFDVSFYELAHLDNANKTNIFEKTHCDSLLFNSNDLMWSIFQYLEYGDLVRNSCILANSYSTFHIYHLVLVDHYLIPVRCKLLLVFEPKPGHDQFSHSETKKKSLKKLGQKLVRFSTRSQIIKCYIPRKWSWVWTPIILNVLVQMMIAQQLMVHITSSCCKQYNQPLHNCKSVMCEAPHLNQIYVTQLSQIDKKLVVLLIWYYIIIVWYLYNHNILSYVWYQSWFTAFLIIFHFVIWKKKQMNTIHLTQ